MSCFKTFLSMLILVSIPAAAHAQQDTTQTVPSTSAIIVQPAETQPVTVAPSTTPIQATTTPAPTADVVEMPMVDETQAPPVATTDQTPPVPVTQDAAPSSVSEQPIVEEKPLTLGTATLDIYSGRTNPTWELTPEQAEEALKKVSKLPKNNMPYQRMVKLGYRGINVKIVKDGVKKPIEIICEHGVIIRHMDGKTQNFSDDKRAFELWLAETGKGKLDKSVITPILTEIKGPATILK